MLSNFTMTSFEEIVSQQKAIGDRIETIIWNYKKYSPTKKTYLEYFQERLRRLDEELSLFETNDNKIPLIQGFQLDKQYFAGTTTMRSWMLSWKTKTYSNHRYWRCLKRQPKPKAQFYQNRRQGLKKLDNIEKTTNLQPSYGKTLKSCITKSQISLLTLVGRGTWRNLLK